MTDKKIYSFDTFTLLDDVSKAMIAWMMLDGSDSYCVELPYPVVMFVKSGIKVPKEMFDLLSPSTQAILLYHHKTTPILDDKISGLNIKLARKIIEAYPKIKV